MGPCSGKPKQKAENQANDAPVQKDGTKGATNEEFKVGPDIFVHLKSGSISNQYKIDRVLGEGMTHEIYEHRGFRIGEIGYS